MAISPFCSAAASTAAISRRPVENACCRPEDDPFLLLESTLRAVEEILVRRRALPLRRTWIDHAYGEEEITLLEEELLPAGLDGVLRHPQMASPLPSSTSRWLRSSVVLPSGL